MSTLDFFLIEGNDLLEQLDALAQHPAGQFLGGDELLRLARAFRGSAVMGGQMGLAHAGQGFEACARALREARLEWNEGIRGEIIRAVDDCKILMRRLKAPDIGDSDKAEVLGSKLEKLAGGRPSATTRAVAAAGMTLDAGARAFVAREAAAIASALAQVAKAARASGAGREAFAGVAPAMSALRGVAVLNDLPPISDVLAAVDAAAREAMADAAATWADAFDAAAKTLSRAAKEVVDAGKPDPASEEAKDFAARLLAALGGDVVDIATLFYADAGPHVIQQGLPPTGGLNRSDLVSHGEYLVAAAAGLEKAATPVERDLRLFALAAGIRPLLSAGSGALGGSLGKFAETARALVAGGQASGMAPSFARRMTEASRLLVSGGGDEQGLADKLAQVTVTLGKAEPAGETPKSRATRALTTPPAAPAVAAAPPPAPPAPPARGEADLATSYLTLEELINDRGLPMGTIDDLLMGGTGLPDGAAKGPVVPIESLAPDESGVVPIESLLYRGQAALKRALELKAEINTAPPARREELLREVFELVELGLGGSR